MAIARANQTDDHTSDTLEKAERAAARVPDAVDDVISTIESEIDEALPETAIGLPERKYSFNALLAVGLAGFVIGRIFSR